MGNVEQRNRPCGWWRRCRKVNVQDVTISKYVDSSSPNVILNFAKVNVDYTPQKDDGSKGKAIPFGWDIAANSKE